MSNTKISQLTDPGTALGPDEFRIARFNGLDYDDYKLEVDDVVTYVDTQLTPISSSDIGIAGGIAPLDGGGLVPSANLPYTTISYQGTWDASTNTPVIASGVGTVGDFYWIMTAGSTTIDGISSWLVGDAIVFDGSVWQKGTMGSPGTPGPAGNTVLSGAANPTIATGTNGDFYINTTTNTIFGPKAAGTWPSGVLLVGPTGAAGAAGAAGSNGTNGTNGTNGLNGSTLLNGSGVPNNAVGVNGDFYLDTTNTIIYGPKSGGVWLTPGTSLIGPAGLPGSGTGANAINTAAYWGAVGNGTFVSVAAAINPLTNVAYGAGGLTAAETRWNTVRERWSIDTFNLTAITSYPVGGTFTIATPGIGSSVTYTVPAIPPVTLTDLAQKIAETINNSSSGNLALSRAANSTGTVVTVYTKSTNAVTMTKSATVLGSITAARTKIFNNSTINMSTDSVDWVALQQLMYLTETNVNTNYVEFTAGSNYVLSRALDMPNKTASSNKIFTINGNNAALRPLDIATNAARKKLIYRDIPAQRYALDGIQSNLAKIQINNIYFRLPFYTTRDINVQTQSTGCMLMGYQASVKDCIFYGGDIGLDYQFNLQGLVENCEFVEQSVYGAVARNGQWLQAVSDNAQSNGTVMKGVKLRLADRNNFTTDAQLSGIYISGASDCRVEDIILEGAEGARGGTSTSTVTYGTGVKTWSTSNFTGTVGQTIYIEETQFRYMAGTVTSYASGILTVNVTTSVPNGAVNANNWSFRIGNRCVNGIYFNNQGTSVVKDFAIYNVHVEKEFEQYAFKVRASADTQVDIRKIVLIATKKFVRLVESEAIFGTIRLNLEQFPYQLPSDSGPIFKNFINTGVTAWRVKDIMIVPIPTAGKISIPSFGTYNPYDVDDTASGCWLDATRTDIWDVTGGGTIPVNSRFMSIPMMA